MKNKLKYLFNKSYIRNYLYLLGSLFLIEIIFKFISKSSIFSIATIRSLLIINILTAIISFGINFANKVVSKIIMGVVVFLSSTYACFQCGFYNFLGVYGSVQASSQLGAVVDYIKDFLHSFKPYYFLTYIPFVLLLVVMIFIDKKKKNKINLKHNFTLLGGSLIVSSLMVYASIAIGVFQNEYQSVSNLSLFANASNPSLTIEQYGTVGFLFLDLKSAAFPVAEEEVEYQVDNTVKTTVNENTRVIDDTALDALIESEDDKEYNSINKYIKSRTITEKNDYTGLFENKNLIVIMMESVDDIFINPEYYPNFYKLLTGGWYFDNNYSPRNSCATMNNEFSGMTSLYSIYNTCTASKYKTNTYYESLFNLFNNENYVTFSAHDYTEAYYPRSTIHKNMGSGEYYGVEKLGITYSNEYKNWANDDDFMEQVLKIIDNKTSDNDKFMTWLTTVSSHQPYSKDSIQGNKYYDLTSGTNYPSDVRRYMSKLKILDDALGVLIDGLDERGILEDTVIVMYGDHYPYGISTDHLNKVLDYDTSTDYNAEKVPFVIYNKGTTDGTVYSQYTSYLNVLPTLANLFNLNYDPRLYLGNDLFSSDYKSLVVFADGSWKNEVAYYNASKNKIKYYGETTYTDEEIKKINDEINTKVSVSNKIITKNYFSYLDKALKEKKSEVIEESNDICLIDDIVKTTKKSSKTTTTTKKINDDIKFGS